MVADALDLLRPASSRLWCGADPGKGPTEGFDFSGELRDPCGGAGASEGFDVDVDADAMITRDCSSKKSGAGEELSRIGALGRWTQERRRLAIAIS